MFVSSGRVKECSQESFKSFFFFNTCFSLGKSSPKGQGWMEHSLLQNKCKIVVWGALSLETVGQTEAEKKLESCWPLYDKGMRGFLKGIRKTVDKLNTVRRLCGR